MADQLSIFRVRLSKMIDGALREHAVLVTASSPANVRNALEAIQSIQVIQADAQLCSGWAVESVYELGPA